MTEVNKETYIFTIENDTEKSMITSVQKNNKELINNNPINLEDEQNAIAQLNSAINPVAEAAEVSADTPPPPPPVTGEQQLPPQQPAADAKAAERVPESDLTNGIDTNGIDITVTNKKNEVKFQDNVGTLLNQIESSNSIKNKKRLKDYITNTINKPEIEDKRKNVLINNYFKQKTNAKFENNQLTGGTHHTIKRTHKPRNTKSTTRKGHIYRTNRRRTHGKSSARGKKQTRRIANR